MKELLFSITRRDLQLTYFSGKGAGGQHRNKHQNCLRLFHPDSGVRVTGQSHKERRANIKEALGNLIAHPKFMMWHRRKVQEVLEGKSIDKKVEEALDPKNLKIECYQDSQWIECSVQTNGGVSELAPN